MSKVVDLTAILTPNPGKIERIVALFRAVEKAAKAGEPGTLRYEMHKGIKDKNGGVEELVVREVEEAMQTHIAGSDCQVFIKAMEAESLCENVKVIFHKPIVGVESRL
ncbi:putative antibiotic biosynthesis monooxygenase protein [Phaeoacremonium minimum UCRPA7]|uniref:Putative antibiotic biosynthesis monooxygenase protein n=1 Tax=Phaeoacremonium minimum (strain UCR-PA7) TaxID=1286976 RepID=R8BSE9_PHAM7|nr:putative antibiotic biosynthesis monooxygenase protein [Phaeoacremonium minimum UCRPA7]EOO02225.1 putative antibiotic biosynthesis monooxygenase protein [Phaeoacremonium minimum UCRPA7]